MGDINISVGRDVRGNVNSYTANSEVWNIQEVSRVVNEFAEAVAGSPADDTHKELLLAIAALQVQLSTPEGSADKARVRSLLVRVREFAIGSAASLFSAIVTAQVPWIWTA